MSYRVYLDVCCLNRPLDNQSQDRIRLETEAILLIYKKCRLESWNLINSEAIEFEISKTPDSQRIKKVELALSIEKGKIPLSNEVKQRSIELVKLGFKPFDAIHIASAEIGQVDVMLTTDDRLLRKYLQYQDQIKVLVKNPVNWLLEINQGDDDDSN